MRWKPFEVEPEWPLECVCCGELMPDGEAVVSARFYDIDAYDAPDEAIESFSKVFDIPNPLADFHICQACLSRYGHFGEEGDPMEWLGIFLEEDAKVISRQEALRILGD